MKDRHTLTANDNESMKKMNDTNTFTTKINVRDTQKSHRSNGTKKNWLFKPFPKIILSSN